MNSAEAARMVIDYAVEASGRIKPEEDGYMRPDGRQLFEVQPLDEFIIDIRKELLDVVNYAAFGLYRLDQILADIEHLQRHSEPMSPREAWAQQVGQNIKDALEELATPMPEAADLEVLR